MGLFFWFCLVIILGIALMAKVSYIIHCPKLCSVDQCYRFYWNEECVDKDDELRCDQCVNDIVVNTSSWIEN
jgi:hypothetical protein